MLEIARALTFQSKMSDRFWGECVLTTCYLINILPYDVLEFFNPFEKLYNRPPDLEHLRIFGCLCYGKNLNPQNKFDERFFPSVFVGYSNVKKIYKLFNLKTKTFYYRRDVNFF